MTSVPLLARPRAIGHPHPYPSAAGAIAESVSDEELSEVHIMPSVFNPEVSRRVAIAVEAAARAEGVARN